MLAVFLFLHSGIWGDSFSHFLWMPKDTLVFFIYIDCRLQEHLILSHAEEKDEKLDKNILAEMKSDLEM